MTVDYWIGAGVLIRILRHRNAQPGAPAPESSESALTKPGEDW